MYTHNHIYIRISGDKPDVKEGGVALVRLQRRVKLLRTKLLRALGGVGQVGVGVGITKGQTWNEWKVGVGGGDVGLGVEVRVEFAHTHMLGGS